MGVSGSGKTTVAHALVDRLGWAFAEGDDLHPPANVAKMRSGQPLTDADRQPWLERVAARIGQHEAAGENAVVSCSALRRAYRDVLREGHPSVIFVHIDVPTDLLRERLAARADHYMPATLLDSQLADLERLAPDEEGIVAPGVRATVDVTAFVLNELRDRGASRLGGERGPRDG